MRSTQTPTTRREELKQICVQVQGGYDGPNPVAEAVTIADATKAEAWFIRIYWALRSAWRFTGIEARTYGA